MLQLQPALKAPLDAPAFTGTVTGITNAMVNLGNVDDTSDANKPVSSAVQTQLDLKAPISAPSFTGTLSVGSGATIASIADTGQVDCQALMVNGANGILVE